MADEYIWLRLDEKYLKEHTESARALSIEENGDEDGKDDLRFGFDNGTKEGGIISSIEIEEIDSETGTVVMTADTPLGYISMNAKLDMDDLIRLMEIAVKRVNKFKTILEGMK